MKLLATFGFVTLALGAQASLFTFDSGPLTLNDAQFDPNLDVIVGLASQTPVDFNVSGLDGAVTNVAIYFNGMSHSVPDDLGAVLFSSGGASTILFDGPGVGNPVNISWDWKFDESVTSVKLSNLLDNPTGFYAAGQNQFNDVFVGGAPAGPYGTSLLNYNGLSAAAASGHWNLYIEDFVPGDSGSIENVQLRITTSPVPEPASLAVLGLGAVALIRRRKRS